MQKKLIEFFESHPDTDVVFAALGVLFLELDNATAYCGGTSSTPETFTREQVLIVDAPQNDAPQNEAPQDEAPQDEAPAGDTEHPITEEALNTLELPKPLTRAQKAAIAKANKDK